MTARREVRGRPRQAGGLRDGRRRERGSLALEFALVVPALFMLLALVFAYGRVSQVNGTMEAGVRDAARSASQARDAAAALVTAERVVRTALGPGATSCLGNLRVELVTTFVPGTAVTVSAECSYSMQDLGLPGMPGSVTTRSIFSSPLDPNRGVR
jgi:Flp pilus assembly protein TadG